MSAALVTAALELASAGWEVFPLVGKSPATKHGFRDATSDEDQIRSWWRTRPMANVGIAVPVNMVVLDIDPRDGGDRTLSALERNHGQLPATLTTITGSGGQHRWFKTPTLNLLQTDLGPGLQTRVGGKGYCVGAGSIHPETHLPYRWVEPFQPQAPLPHWVRQRLLPPVRPNLPTLTVVRGEGRDFLRWAFERVAAAPMGCGHDTLLRTARLAGGYVGAGLVSEAEVRRTLHDAVATWERPYRLAVKTIEDGITHGLQSPVKAS